MSGALTSVQNEQTGFIYWQAGNSGATDAFGHLLTWTDGNNVATTMTYDAATGAPTEISSGVSGASGVQLLTYTWDGYGNLMKRQDGNQNLSETFGYDDLNRLTSSTVTNPAGDGPCVFHRMPVTGFTSCRSRVSPDAGQRFHGKSVTL